jgi:hypothetical protein
MIAEHLRSMKKIGNNDRIVSFPIEFQTMQMEIFGFNSILFQTNELKSKSFQQISIESTSIQSYQDLVPNGRN